jgi:Amino acid transporters
MNPKLEVVENLNSQSDLRSECLSPIEVLGQSIANIAPSCAPALGIPLVFTTAGNGTWLAYLFATIAIALVGYHVNYFAKRSATPGALYSYVSDGLGPAAGFISGNGLVLAYLLTASAVLAGFANYANVLLDYAGLHAPPIVLAALAIVAAWYLTYKDIQLSAKVMLAVEGTVLLLIAVLCGIVFFKSGIKIDYAQLTLQDISTDSIRIGLVLAFFSFVGFESATTLGAEAKNPFRSIPRAVIASALFVGTLFVIFSYIEIIGFTGSDIKLNEAAAPLTYLATQNGMGIIGFFISIGVALGMWSCAVACITAGARILLTMGRHKMIPASSSKVHESNDTPYVAVTMLAVAAFSVPAVLLFYGAGIMDIFGWVGTIATLGFLLSYVMIVLAGPVYLYKRNELKLHNVIIAIVSFVILCIPMVGSVYPLPAYPYNMFPFIFLAWLLLSGLWFSFVDARRANIEALKRAHETYVEYRKAYLEALKRGEVEKVPSLGK